MIEFALACLFILISFKSAPPTSAIEVLQSSKGVIQVNKYVPESFESLPYEATVGWTKDEYLDNVQLLNSSVYEYFEMTYLSGIYKVKALVGLPKNCDFKTKHTAIIYNRGGNREYGRVLAFTLNSMSKIFGSSGKNILFFPQYRGVAGGEGNDEFGGKDIEDVLNLLKITQNFVLANSKKIFIAGWSRGGMMTYLALKNAANVKGAIVIAGSTDLELSDRERPELRHNVHNVLIPEIFNNRSRLLDERSALKWIDKINVPILIIHGTEDKLVSFQHSKLMAEGLKNSKKKYKFVVYEGEGHSLLNMEDDLKFQVEHFLKQ